MGLTYVLVAMQTGAPEASTFVDAVGRRLPFGEIIEIQKGQWRRRRQRRD